MDNKLKKPAWWLLLLLSITVPPIIPAATVLTLGWVMPGKISWFYADASVPIGPLASVAACTFLIARSKKIPVVRFLFICAVIFCMSFVAKIELTFARECVTQRGMYINFQQQQQDIEAANGLECQ